MYVRIHEADYTIKKEIKRIMNYKELSELIYPSLEHTPEEYEAIYPPRDLPEGAMVTRLGPSPRGFIHL